MFAPPNNGYRILIYGTDSTLLETRRLLLAFSGFRVDTVSNLPMLRRAVTHARPGYELIILCHTVPIAERDEIEQLGIKISSGIYQLGLMENPPRFIGTVSEMMSNP